MQPTIKEELIRRQAWERLTPWQKATCYVYGLKPVQNFLRKHPRILERMTKNSKDKAIKRIFTAHTEQQMAPLSSFIAASMKTPAAAWRGLFPFFSNN